MELEDTFADVIGKAQRGLGLSDRELSARAGLDEKAISALKAGRFSEKPAVAAAEALGLGAAALVALGQGKYPAPGNLALDGLESFSSAYNDMTVNSHLAWNPSAKAGVVFDTGADCGSLLAFLAERGIRVPLVLLTHIHEDHIADLDRLRHETGAEAFVSAAEPLEGCASFEWGHRFKIGGIEIETRRTTGHSRGGTTFVVSGLGRPIAVVGDALFAGSMGNGFVSYEEALRTNFEQVLTLPEETVICPGHGPRTTVGHERRNNPFLTGRASQDPAGR